MHPTTSKKRTLLKAPRNEVSATIVPLKSYFLGLGSWNLLFVGMCQFLSSSKVLIIFFGQKNPEHTFISFDFVN